MAARLNIVVVEDHDDLRELTCLALSHRGHHVVGLSCAEELEDQAGGGPVDVFVIDLNLPGEDGNVTTTAAFTGVISGNGSVYKAMGNLEVATLLRNLIKLLCCKLHVLVFK